MKRRKFTTSRDGTPRTTVRVTLRLAPDEVRLLEEWAARGGRGRQPATLEDVVWAEADLAVEGLIADIQTGRTT